jgi:hypothetical protein
MEKSPPRSTAGQRSGRLSLSHAEPRVLLAVPTMTRSVIAVGVALAVAAIGAVFWTDKSGGVGAATAAGDAGGDAARPSHEAGDATAPEDRLSTSPDSGRAAVREAEDDFGLPIPKTLLPTTSPKTVRFGVILVQYRGAQAAAPSARSKEEALALARTIAQDAKIDFKSQLGKGDPGSMEDAGTIPRGVLESVTEYALFTLGRGDVSDPIDTPRGFWIMRRIE